MEYDQNYTGTSGNDNIDIPTLFPDLVNDTWLINALEGNDTVVGGSNNDRINGGAGEDELYGGANDDQLYGQDDDDLLDGGTGADMMYGGIGGDVYVVDNVGDRVIENAGEGDYDLVRTHIDNYVLPENVENLFLQGNAAIHGYGNELDNTLMGYDLEAVDEYLDGREGDDWLAGRYGSDTLIGGDGDDFIDGGKGNYIDSMEGGNGDDSYVVYNNGDIIVEDAGQGIDTIFTNVDKYSLETHQNVENLTLFDSASEGSGNNLNNVLTGNDLGNYLQGNSGNDTLDGGAGNDTLLGGAGDDSLDGGADNDYLRGGDGNDSLLGGDGNDNILGDAGDDTLLGGAGNDTLNSYEYNTNGSNHLDGGTGDDNIYGNINDTLLGGADNDYLSGGSSLSGGEGNDSLLGNAGNDYVDGGTGNDILHGYNGYSSTNTVEYDDLLGGSGADTFALGNSVFRDVHGGTDIFYQGFGYADIIDFDRNEGDKIAVSKYTSFGDYTLNKNFNFGGGSELDTAIYYNSDLIGIAYDTTEITVSQDFTFW